MALHAKWVSDPSKSTIFVFNYIKWQINNYDPIDHTKIENCKSVYKLVKLLGNYWARKKWLPLQHHQSGTTGFLNTDWLMIEWVWRKQSFDCNLRYSSSLVEWTVKWKMGCNLCGCVEFTVDEKCLLILFVRHEKETQTERGAPRAAF